MTKPEAIKLLLKHMNSNRTQGGGMFSVMGGTTGNINVLQKDINQALDTWGASGDTHGLLQMAATLQTMGNLPNAEYEQIMEALDGEN